MTPNWQQEHRVELQSGFQSRSDSIFSSAREITNGFITLIGHDDLHEVAGARLASEQQRIAPIGLDAPLGRASRKYVPAQ